MIIAGISIAAILLAVWGIRNQNALKCTWAYLRGSIESKKRIKPSVKSAYISEKEPLYVISKLDKVPHSNTAHRVSEHIRNLPDGWKASSEKMKMAAHHGYELKPGQTWVKEYVTGGIAA